MTAFLIILGYLAGCATILGAAWGLFVLILRSFAE